MNKVELYIDKRKQTQFSDFRSIRINVERNEETWNVSANLEGIELYGEDYVRFLQLYELDPYRRIEVELRAGGVVLKGFVDYTSVRVGDGRLTFSAALDEKTRFEREIAGQLIRADGTTLVSVERQIDTALAVAYIVAAALYLEVAIRSVIRIKKDIADVAAILATAGPGAPAASIKLAIVRILLRTIYTGIVLVALARLFEMIVKFIPQPKLIKYAKITNAISRACAKAGYNVVFPPGAEKLFIVSNYVDTIEIVELIKTLQVITNTRLFVNNKIVRFEPRRVVPFPFADRAYTEFWQYNIEEIPGREVISLARDFADFHADELPHNVEIVTEAARGYKRSIIPFAPAKSKVKLSALEAVLNEIIEFFRRAWPFTKNRTVSLRYVANIPVVQDDVFVPRLIYANSLTTYVEADERGLLDYIAKNYTEARREAKRYEAKMFLSLEEFSNLAQAGWPGVVRMSYTPATETAEVTYEMPASYTTRERSIFIA